MSAPAGRTASSLPESLRREPPAWIEVVVTRREVLGDHMLRISLAGDGLSAMETPTVASSIRLLVPGSDNSVGGALEIPEWAGNEFLLASGERPVIRTFTPLWFDADAASLVLDVVRHPHGAISGWAESAEPGDTAAVSGPGRGFEPDPAARHWLLLGDETALPAMGQLLEALPADVPIDAYAEVGTPDAHGALLIRPGATVTYLDRPADRAPGHSLTGTVASITELQPGTHVWAAGEAAAMHALRKDLDDRLGVPRARTTIRGYWKVPRHAPSMS